MSSYIDVPKAAKFSLTALNALISSDELAFLKTNNGTAFDALDASLKGLRSYLTLDIVNTDSHTSGLVRIGESSLRVYEQKVPDLGAVTATRYYRDDLWSQTDVDSGNL